MKKFVLTTVLLLLFCSLGFSQSKGVKSDCFGDPLPRGALARLGTARFRHGPSARFTLSPQGRWLAVSENYSLFVYHLKHPQLNHHHSLRSQTRSKLVYSPQGDSLAWLSHSGPPLAVLDLRRNKIARWTVAPLPDSPSCDHLRFDPSGDHLLIWNGRAWKLVSRRTGKKVLGAVLPPDEVLCDLRFNAKGDLLSLLRRGNVAMIRNVRTKQVHGRWELPKLDDLDYLELTHDGKEILTTGFRNKMGIWSTEAQRATYRLLKKNSWVWLSASGRHVLLQQQEGKICSLRVAHLTSGKEITVFRKNNEENCDVAISQDGSRIAIRWNNELTVRVFDLADQKEVQPLLAANAPVLDVRFGKEEKVAYTLTADSVVTYWDVSTGKLIRRIPFTEEVFPSLALTTDGKLLVVRLKPDPKPKLVYLDAQTGERKKWPKKTSAEVRHWFYRVNSKGKLTWIQQDSSLSPNPKRTSTDVEERAIPLGYAPDGKVTAWTTSFGDFIVKARDGHQRPFRMSQENQQFGQFGFTGAVGGYGFSPNSQWIAYHGCFSTGTGLGIAGGHGLRGGVGLRAFGAFGNLGGQFGLKGGSIGSFHGWRATGAGVNGNFAPPLNFQSPASNLLGGDPGHVTSKVLIRHVRFGEARRPITTRLSPEMSQHLTFSPNGATLAVSTPEGIRFYEVLTGQERLLLRSARSKISRLFCTEACFSPTGRLLLQGFQDSSSLIWDATGIAQARVLKPPNREHVEQWWGDLKSNDAKKAYRAIGQLARFPKQSLPWLKQRLKPIRPVDVKELKGWIDQLDAESYEHRATARAKILSLGMRAHPHLKSALTKDCSPEQRQSLKKLTYRLSGQFTLVEQLQQARAIEVLTLMQSKESTTFLQAITQGDPKSAITRQARYLQSCMDAQRERRGE